MSGHSGIVGQLIKARANLDISTRRGLTPIFIACQKDHIECVKALFKAGASVKCLTESGNFFGKKMNSELRGVGEKMKALIKTIIKKENIKERDEALVATTQLSPSPRSPRAGALVAQQTQGVQGR